MAILFLQPEQHKKHLEAAWKQPFAKQQLVLSRNERVEIVYRLERIIRSLSIRAAAASLRTRKTGLS